MMPRELARHIKNKYRILNFIYDKYMAIDQG